MTSVHPPRRQTRLKRRWLPWLLGIVVLLVWAIIATVLVAVFRNELGPTVDEREVSIDDDRLSIEITVPPQLAIESIFTNTRAEGCPVPTYLVGGPRGDDPGLMLEAMPSDCRLGENQNSLIGNGKHGIYRSIDDVEGAMDVRQLETEIGTATVFTQEYDECTNSCTNFIEPVAIIELTDPANPDYPTLVVHGMGDDFSREDLEQILSTLEPAD